MKRMVLAVVVFAVIAGLLWLAVYDFLLISRHIGQKDFWRFIQPQVVTGNDPARILEVPASRKKHSLETPYQFAVRENKTRGIVETDRYLLYLPEDVDWRKKFPLVFAMSPDGNAEPMFRAWRKTADKHKWILASSKEHRNGIDFSKIMPLLTRTIHDIQAAYPVDRSRVIASGFSGGGMGAHYMSMAYPDLISAVVVNTCMIHENFENGKGYQGPSGQRAVFLASPTDFRYDEMRRNKDLLDRLGWKTKWIEFSEGHTIAPDSAYQEAAQWLAEQFQ